MLLQKSINLFLPSTSAFNLFSSRIKTNYIHDVALDSKGTNFSHENIKPFSEIPGPLNFPLVGTILPYKLGIKHVKDYHTYLFDLYDNYGPVVRENLGGQVIIHVFDPNDIQKVYEADGKIPFIPPLQETTQLYRQSKDMSPGLGNVNGPQWYKLRHAVQQMMLRPKEVSHYLPLQDKVAQLAVNQLSKYILPDGSVNHLDDWVAKWILESAGTVCFETSLGSFDGLENEDRAQKLVNANRQIFQITADLKFSLRLYRYFKTPKYKRLLKLEDFFYGISTDFIHMTIDKITKLLDNESLGDGEFNFLSYLMSRKDLTDKDVITITLSLFTDGLSTTVPTLLGNLHCLALKPEVQEKLFNEVSTYVQDDKIISQKVLNKMSYLKAFVKEVFRFYPIGETVQRLTQKELVIKGYHIPAGTYIDLNPYIWLRNEDIFKDANIINPDRWLRDGGRLKDGSSVHPYILNPFSVGTRMCAGRRFAEQDLYLGLCRFIKKYKIEATTVESPAQEWKTLLYPKLPLPVKIMPRN